MIVRDDFEGSVIERAGDLESPFSGRQAGPVLSEPPETAICIRKHADEPGLVVDSNGETLGLRDQLEHTGKVAERVENVEQRKSKVDALFRRLSAVRQMPERLSRSFERNQRLSVCAPARGFVSRFSSVKECLVPQLASEGVARQPIDVLRKAPRPQLLDGAGDAPVKGAALAMQETRVGNLER
jgi:hypothetical protein